jgi:methylated-DNA-protein-cysteine methyltransferase-like protein
MDTFTRHVIDIIKTIPVGNVATYGDIAAAAGNHSGARQVARILHSSSRRYDLPWHRVVNRKQEISPRAAMGHLTQRRLLEEEGVAFDERGKIDFARFLWIPGR